MKKKILKILKKSLSVIFWSGFFNIIFVWFIWQNKQYNISNGYIKPENKKILFHLFGVTNMTTEEKIALLEQSPSFREYFDGKIDVTVANKVFPDQSPKYAVDSEFVIDFHLSHGNPDIQIGFAGWFRDHFNPITGMSLSAFNPLGKPETISLYSYFSEMTHSAQFDDNPYDYELRSFKGIFQSALLVIKNGYSFEHAYNFQYSQRGSLEYEAHSVLYLKLREKYLDYRCLCFKEQIDEIEKEIYDYNARPEKNEGSVWEKFRPEWIKLQAKRDSLVYGPLFLH